MSQADKDQFISDHNERCRQRVEDTAFYADVIADTLSILSCRDREQAYSIGEAIRMAASRVLDMEIEDLQILTIGRSGSEEVDLLLYDPMPGGSGLLDQVITRWPEVAAEAREIVERCPSVCERSCIDCLQTFRDFSPLRLEEWFFHGKQLAVNAVGSALEADKKINLECRIFFIVIGKSSFSRTPSQGSPVDD